MVLMHQPCFVDEYRIISQTIRPGTDVAMADDGRATAVASQPPP